MDFFNALENKYQNRHIARKYRSKLKSILRWINYYQKREPIELSAELLLESNKLKNDLIADPSLTDKFLPKAYAIFSIETLLSFGWAPNETQLLAAVLLWHGKVVEMKSGEGKTITAALPAYLQALTGRGMHIITTNDYLAERDKEWIGAVYNRLGISCGVVTQFTKREDRKKEYAKDITYVSNQEIGFDYLRDNLVVKEDQKVLQGFPFAIVDEIDSILIDEARTPLIISKAVVPTKYESLSQVLDVAKQLILDEDYEIDLRFKTINFTDNGIAKIIRLIGRDIFSLGDLFTIKQLRFVLYASVFLKKGHDFILNEDKIILVDEFTGHPMPNRRLLDGLGQIIEAVNGIPMREEYQINATITFRDLFKMYDKMTGMSGTAMAVKEEFSELYNLDTIKIDPHRSVARIDLPTLFFRTEKEKYDFILKNIQEMHANGDPILIVGRSVNQVKYFSGLLNGLGLGHQLLHAELTEKEFEIVQNAGKRGAITVATNMAGRGMDIIIEAESKEANGLIVYSLESNFSKRIDDQLRGRSGRQGDRGVSKFFVSLEDEIFQVYADDALWDWAEKISWPETGVTNKKIEKFLENAQNIAESIASQMRKNSVQFESVLNKYSRHNNSFRDRLLKANNIAAEITQTARRVFLEEIPKEMNEYDLFWIYADIIGKLKAKAASFGYNDYCFGIFKTVLNAVFNEKEKNKTHEALLNMPPDNNEKMRQQILFFIDDHWQKYLSEINELSDRVFVEAMATDPLIDFINRSDIIYHNMHRQLVSQMLYSLFCEIISLKERNIY